MLSATISDKSANFDRLDAALVKNEYKNEVATTDDDCRALSNTVVHDALT